MQLFLTTFYLSSAHRLSREEYIALKSRCRNSIDRISINFHLEFDIFFIGEQHKLFKGDGWRGKLSPPRPEICFWIFLVMNTSAKSTYCMAGTLHTEAHSHTHKHAHTHTDEVCFGATLTTPRVPLINHLPDLSHLKE